MSAGQQTLQVLVGPMEQRLGLTPGFLARIDREDDWSFVIKVSPLIEATVTHLVVTTLSNPAIADTFSRMQMTGRRGKRAFARDLGLLTKDEDLVVEELFTVRNSFAHDPRSAAETLEGICARSRQIAPRARTEADGT